MLFALFSRELAARLHDPSLGPALRAVCVAVAAPDVHGAALRRAIAAFVAAARARGHVLEVVQLALEHVLREFDGAVPPHDRPRLAAFVLRRAAVLYAPTIVGLQEAPTAGSPDPAAEPTGEPARASTPRG